MNFLLMLKPSKIHGVGVFAVRNISKGFYLPLFSEDDWLWVKNAPKGKNLRYCTQGEGGYWRPLDWNRMSIGWYLNESINPNVSKHWYTLRHIKKGEELTVNYAEL